MLLWSKLRRIGDLSRSLGITIDPATFDDATFERLCVIESTWQELLAEARAREARR